MNVIFFSRLLESMNVLLKYDLISVHLQPLLPLFHGLQHDRQMGRVFCSNTTMQLSSTTTAPISHFTFDTLRLSFPMRKPKSVSMRTVITVLCTLSAVISLDTLPSQRRPCSCLASHRLTTVNTFNTKRRLLYLKTQFVPRSKHFSSRL